VGRQHIPALFKERVALTPPQEASYFRGRWTGYGTSRSPINEKVTHPIFFSHHKYD